MSLFLNDVRYAARVLLKSRGFTVIALLTLALAIGANTAIFSVINAMLLRPLPFRAPDQLVQVQRGFPGGDGGPTVNVPEFLHVQRNSRSFSGLTTYDTLGSGFNLTGDSVPERIVGSRVSQQFFSVFGVRPQLGRDFLREEDRPGGPKVVMLSDGLWKRRFGADPALVGKALNLNGEPYTVIGVTPPGFRYPATAELWTPVGIDPNSQERANYLEITGRLKDGVSFEKAQAEMTTLAERLRKANPDRMNEKETIRLKTLQVRLYGQMRPALLVLLGAVGCVLLIACVNVANLQLARATARRRDMAIRAALGARSSRIFAQLLTESVLLALVGGALGLLLGWATIKPLLALIPGGQVGQIIRASLPPIRIDGMVLLFTFGVSLVAGVLFGLAPALQAVRVNLHEPLKEGTNKSTGGRKGLIARRFLVMSEVALALVLITGAALLLKSFAGLTDRELGFRPDHVLTLKVSLPEARYGKPEALEQLSRQLAERLRAIPGVRAAAVASSVPLELGPDLPFAIEGKWPGGTSQEGIGDAQYRASTGGYFESLRIPLSRGRFLTDRDQKSSEPVAVINETAARQFWKKGEEALGSRIRVGVLMSADLIDPQPRRIVGIVKDVREVGLDEDAPPIIYVPIGQITPGFTAMLVRLLPTTVAVRTDGSPAALTAAVSKEIWAVDPQLPITDVKTMEQIVQTSVGSFRFLMVLMGSLAALALLLAAVGIYGVLSYLVSQRSREIGVRMALGASAWNVLKMVVGQGMLSVAIGLAAGLGLALLAARILRSQLVGVSAHDPVTFILASLVLSLVALIASSIPARRASLLDPVLALRRD
jgi:putative ABC transport system permease protein